jgi:hypothetical protein
MVLKQLVNESGGPWRPHVMVRPAPVLLTVAAMTVAALTVATMTVGVVVEVFCTRLQIMRSRIVHIHELIVGGIDNANVGEKR